MDEVRGEVFNVGGGPANTLSLRELVSRLEQSFGPRVASGLRRLAAGRPARLRGRRAKGGTVAGLASAVGIAEGVERLMGWVQENRAFLAQ